jgi:membrane-bound lytic murein transglycosylase D
MMKSIRYKAICVAFFGMFCLGTSAQSETEFTAQNEEVSAASDSTQTSPADSSMVLADSSMVLVDASQKAIDIDSLHAVIARWQQTQPRWMIEEGDISENIPTRTPDSVFVARLDAMNSYIPLSYNHIVHNFLALYSDRRRSSMGDVLGRCNIFMPIFEEIFNRYDLPEELKAMAIIESALNPTATSHAGAKGLWQFMYSTGKRYGLQIDSFVDERLDIYKSADAAARYLRDAYYVFGDWALAISSYNCGPGNVQKAIRRSGSRNFWDLYEWLPRETRGYFPAFIAALYITRYYKEHGIVPKIEGEIGPIDTIRVNKMLHFEQIEKVAGIPRKTLRSLNPQYRHDIVPGKDKEFILRIPYSSVNQFIDHEKEIYQYKADSLFNPVRLKKLQDGMNGERIIYKVRNGDVLGKIAMRYHCKVSQIKRWNNLKSDRIRVGQKLVIYRGGRKG